MSNKRSEVKPWARAVILVVAVVFLGLIAWLTTGEILPQDPNDALLLQSSLLLVVLGSLILETYFTRPGDALVNALTALITLIPLARTAPTAPWLSLIGYLAVVLGASFFVILLQGSPRTGRLLWSQNVAYRISTTLGQSKVLFTVVFLSAVIFFISIREGLTLALVVFWGLYIAIWPLGVPQLLSRLTRTGPGEGAAVGHIVRVDSPGIARVSLVGTSIWKFAETAPLVVNLFDGQTKWGVPLFSESRSDGAWGTLLLASDAPASARGVAGSVTVGPAASAPDSAALLKLTLALEGSTLIGLVREGSTVGHLRVEILPGVPMSVGQLVVTPSTSGPVYYQITEGETSEEAFGGLNYGSQVAHASPVGRLGADHRFQRYGWLPSINAPVFQLSEAAKQPEQEVGEKQVVLGDIPGTGLKLVGDFVANLESHTAILGVTGSGKTELAFDLIENAVANGVKVICIDLTSQYAPRLAGLAPAGLSIDATTATDLGNKLFDVETGTFGAPAEKKLLSTFATTVRADVEARLKGFVKSGDPLGLIELREISNTKATLWVTEMYLSTLLKLAKDGLLGGGKVLVVVEEAHTVMPEASFLGLGDFDSKGTVAKITQIALQGRKYGVGLLVIAQRTATVSKSVLTQCNTVISFSCIDDTSIGFLRNVFGSTVAEQLPNLPRLRAIAHGPWIHSEVPIAFDVPFNQKKADTTNWAAQSSTPGAASTILGSAFARVDPDDVGFNDSADEEVETDDEAGLPF